MHLPGTGQEEKPPCVETRPDQVLTHERGKSVVAASHFTHQVLLLPPCPSSYFNTHLPFPSRALCTPYLQVTSPEVPSVAVLGSHVGFSSLHILLSGGSVLLTLIPERGLGNIPRTGSPQGAACFAGQCCWLQERAVIPPWHRQVCPQANTSLQRAGFNESHVTAFGHSA